MENYLLKSATYYYYNLLNDNNKNLYKQVLASMLNFEQVCNVSGRYTYQDAQQAVYGVINDRPDIFWNRGGSTVSSAGNYVTKITFDYIYSKSESYNIVEKMLASPFYKEMCKLTASKNNDFEKALAAYEYIIQHTSYDIAARNGDSSRRKFAYCMNGVILEALAVCSGYAKTFQYFMNKFNINCTLVTGNTSKGSHAWNLLSLYGSWYYVDTTWGDPVFSGTSDPNYISYDYFCFNTESMQKTHNPKLDAKMPLCTATKYNYFEYFGLIDDSYYVTRVANHIADAKRGNKEFAMFRYRTASEYKKAVKMLFEKSEIFDALSIASARASGIKTGKVNYKTDDTTYTIKIYL